MLNGIGIESVFFFFLFFFSSPPHLLLWRRVKGGVKGSVLMSCFGTSLGPLGLPQREALAGGRVRGLIVAEQNKKKKKVKKTRTLCSNKQNRPNSQK